MLDPMDDCCYDGIMDTTVANLGERNEAQHQDGACESPQDHSTRVEHEKTARNVDHIDIECEEDLSKKGKFQNARKNLKKINVMVKSKIDGLGRVAVFGGRKKAEKQKEQKHQAASHDSPQAETKPQPAHTEAEPQEPAGTRPSSAAVDNIPTPDDLMVFTDDVDTSSNDAVDGSTPITGYDPQDLSRGHTPDSSPLNLSSHSPQESSKIINVSNETNTVNQDNCCQSSGVFSQVEDTSERQLPNTAADETGSAGSPGAHGSSDVVKCVSGATSWADSIKSTASSVSPSVNRGCLEGSGPAVPVDFVNPHVTLAKIHVDNSDYNRFYFNSLKSVLDADQIGQLESGHDSLDNHESEINSVMEVSAEPSDVEKVSESEDDFWGSEFDESSSQDEVLLDDRGYEIDETPDKPLPPKPGKKVFFRRSRTVSSDTTSTDESGSCLPVTINLQKHPQPALPPQPSGLTQNQIKRRLVVDSIIGSERSYLDSLERLVRDYEKTLLEFITQPKSHVRRVFSKMREIIGHHKMFQIELSERVKLWDEEEKIGDIFTASFSKTMLINAYSVYVNNFSAAMDEVRLLQRGRQTFQDFLQKQEKSSPDRLSIFGLMVKPVQRFPQFIMFLQDLIKLTPQNHDDRRALQLALTELENVAYRLNERKRQSEQKFQARQTVKMLIKQKVQHVLDTWNLDVDHKRRLIRTDSVEQMFQQGDQDNLKCKERRLILMNDHVLCVKVVHKELSGYEVEKYALRWVEKLKDLELKDTSTASEVQSILGREFRRIPISPQLDESEDDPFHLLADLHEMIHDHTIIKQMSALASRLKRSYVGHGLREELIHEISNDLQQMIQVKEEQLRLVNNCTIILEDTARSDKPHYVIQVPTPALKLDWCIDFLMAKLALDKSNNLAWDGTSGSDGGDFDVVPAYFLKQIPVDVPKNYTSIKCAVSVYLNSKSAIGLGLQHLWVCSSTPTHGQVSVLSVHNSKPALVESFKACGSDILAVELVPGCGQVSQPGKLLFAEDTVWMATSQSEILIFPLTSQDGVRRQPLACVPAPHTTVSVKFVDEQFFCGSTTGILTAYMREQDGSWNVSSPTALSVGSASVRFHFVHQEYMWLSCGSRLSQLEIDSLQVEAVSVLHVNDESYIDHVVKSGVGIWVSFSGNSVIKLFHLETMENLQEISVGNFVSRIITEKSWTISGGCENLAVTALAVSRGFLWIGTSFGLMLTVPLPRLSDGVPLYRGSPKLSLHAHKGPVRFLHLLQCSSGVVEMNRASSLLSTIEARQSQRNLQRKRLELGSLTQTKERTVIAEELENRGAENQDVLLESDDSNNVLSRFSSSMTENVTEQEKVAGLSGKGDKFGLNLPVSNRQSTADIKENYKAVDDTYVQLRNKRKSSDTYNRSKTMAPSLDLIHRNRLKSKAYSQSNLDLNSAEPCEVQILYQALLDDASNEQECRYVGESSYVQAMGDMARRWSSRMSSQMSNSHITTPSWLMTSTAQTSPRNSSQDARRDSPSPKVESHVDSAGGVTESHREQSTRVTESGVADRKQFSKVNSNAVIVVSGGDGYSDLDTTRKEVKMDDACVLMWIHKFY